MQGILITERGIEFYFRDDFAADFKYFGWMIRDPNFGFKTQTYKWDKLPRGEVILFDIDKPPATVSYIPAIR